MVNRLTRNPGEIQRIVGTGKISPSVPDFAVEQGAGARTVAAAAGSLSARLRQLADKAKIREETLAGLSVGQANGTTYLQAREAERQARERVSSQPANAGAIQAYFVSRHGLSPAQAAGIVGNLIQESNLKASGAVGDNGTAFGIAQWRHGRFSALKAFAAERGTTWEDLHTQLDFIMHELGTSEKTAGDLLLRATTVEEATEAFISFERPAGWSPGNPRGGHAFSTRLAHARKLHGAVPAPVTQAAAQSVQPLQLRRDGTIGGDAFDAAAMRAYAWRVDQAISSDLTQAGIDFGDDPAALTQRIDEIRADYLQGEAFADPEAREMFERSFERRAETYRLKAAAEQEKRLKQEELAATTDGLEARRVELERQAFTLGGNAEGDRILAEQLARTNKSIDSAVDAGTIDPGQASSLKATMAESVARGRVKGTFDALETPVQKQQYALALMDDWAEGKGPLAQLPLSTVQGLSSELYNTATAEASRRDGEAQARRAEIQQHIGDDIASITATGQPLDLDEAGITTEEIEAALTPAEIFAYNEGRDRADKIYKATAGFESQHPKIIEARLQEMKPKPGQPDFVDAQQIHELAVKKAELVLEERALDPIGAGVRSGILEDVAIDASTTDTLAETLNRRAGQAERLTLIYGTPYRAFRPGEAEAMTTAMLDNPELLPVFAGAVRAQFGERAADALSEISEAGPVVAHAAGVGLATGDSSVAHDVATTLANKAAKLYTQKMPTQAEFSQAANDKLRGALAALPATHAAVIGTAALLYEQAANKQGFDPADIGETETAANRAWDIALNRALGGRFINGEQYGGLVTVNEQRIVVPSDMRADEPRSLLRGLSDQDLTFLPPIAEDNGIPVTARQIRRGKMVSVGDGLYRLAISDINGPAPEYLATPEGLLWVLDIRKLKALRKR